jgi:uncharacterized protein YybS (DUF2232 family)
MFKAKAITEGAILITLFIILLLVRLYIPIIGGIATFALAIPFIVYTTRHPFKNALFFLFAAMVVTYISSGVLGLPIVIVFGSIGLAMGYVYVNGKSAFSVLITGSIGFILGFLFLYGVSVVFLGIDLQEMLNKSYETAVEVIRDSGQVADKQVELMLKSLEMVKYMIPSLIIISGVIMAIITQVIANQVLKRLRFKGIHTFPPFRDWRFPQSILWYYLLVVFLTLMSLEEGSMLSISVINAYMILEAIMVTQGLTLIFYFSYSKGWKKAIPILITVVLFVTNLFFIVRFLGIIDLGFDLRKRINTGKKE